MANFWLKAIFYVKLFKREICPRAAYAQTGAIRGVNFYNSF